MTLTDRNSIIRAALLETRIVIDATLSWTDFQIRVSFPSLDLDYEIHHRRDKFPASLLPNY